MNQYETVTNHSKPFNVDSQLDYWICSSHAYNIMFMYYQYMHRARWFRIREKIRKINRYELVYGVEYVHVDHCAKKKEKKKYVDIRRMNHKLWKQPMKLTSGLLTIKHYTKVKPPITLLYTKADIEWFLQWGMDSFLKYNAQAM